MGWTYKQRKLRDQMRAQFTAQTGSTDYRSREFAEWVDRFLSAE